MKTPSAAKTIRQPKDGSKEAHLRSLRSEQTKSPRRTVKMANAAKLKAVAGLSASETPAPPAPQSAEPKETTVMPTKAQKKASAKTKARTAVKGKTEGVRPGTKLALVVGLLKRPSGCTTEDVLKATGWPSVSMPQQAKAAGIKLSKEKDGRHTRYRAA